MAVRSGSSTAARLKPEDLNSSTRVSASASTKSRRRRVRGRATSGRNPETWREVLPAPDWRAGRSMTRIRILRSGPLPLDQADIACSRSLGGFLRLKFHTLALSEQLEHSASYSAAMEEVLDTALIADESESLVDEEACDSPGGHNPVLRCASIVRCSTRLRPSRGAADPERKDVRAHRPKSWASVGSTSYEVKRARSPFSAMSWRTMPHAAWGDSRRRRLDPDGVPQGPAPHSRR